MINNGTLQTNGLTNVSVGADRQDALRRSTNKQSLFYLEETHWLSSSLITQEQIEKARWSNSNNLEMDAILGRNFIAHLIVRSDSNSSIREELYLLIPLL